MRIIIEMTETESRSTSVRREVSGQQTNGAQMIAQEEAQDAGPPPEALLLALGARTETRVEATSPVRHGGVTDAGGPPGWLMNVTADRGIGH